LVGKSISQFPQSNWTDSSSYGGLYVAAERMGLIFSSGCEQCIEGEVCRQAYHNDGCDNQDRNDEVEETTDSPWIGPFTDSDNEEDLTAYPLASNGNHACAFD